MVANSARFVLRMAAIACVACLLLVAIGQRTAAEWSDIQQRGFLTVAVKDNWRPLGFRGTDGALQGLEIDIARRLGEELLGSSEAVQLQPVRNQERLALVLDRAVDVAIAGVTVTEPRSRVISFSQPYYLDGTVLVTRDPNVRELERVTGQAIAVLNGSSAVDTVRYLLPGARLVPVNSYAEAYALLEAGDAVAFAGDASVLAGWVQEHPAYFLSRRLSSEPLAVVLPRGLQYEELRRKVNEAIARWQASGWLQERSQFWGLPE